MTLKNQFFFMAFFVLVAMALLWWPMAVGSQDVQVESSFTTAFTYQGMLEYEGEPVDGNEAFSFRLYDAESGGNQIGNAISIAVVPVSNGIFTVELDFGPGSFDEGPRWLEVVTAKAGILEPRQLVNPAPYVGDLAARVEALEAGVEALEAENAALQELLAGVSRRTVDGHDTLRFSGMNVQIVNGTGSTAGDPNRLGNLIVGYNEARLQDKNIRTGSHYLIVGQEHNYSSYGGIVAGYRNEASGNFASVTGGILNTASGLSSSISGGQGNTASGVRSSISGGYDNTASGMRSSISGGHDNTASGLSSSISGGYWNFASEKYASVSGGRENRASGEESSISGGAYNSAKGHRSSISGGSFNNAEGSEDSISGGVGNTTIGSQGPSISGGLNNTVRNAHCGSILGGKEKEVTEHYGTYPR